MGAPTTSSQAKPRVVKRLVLRNVTCIYCGQTLTAAISNEEHVVGRRFVPKGTMAGQWNLIARCCKPCNGKKAKLENDISAILLQPTAFGDHAREDALLVTEATRKGTTLHPTTGKAVKDSTTSITVPAAMTPKLQMTIGLQGPPMVARERAELLAQYHLTAFLYLVTFDKTTRKGQFARGVFHVCDQSLRTDWGNVIQRAFANEVLPWRMVCGIRTARGYFKAAIRRHPTVPCYAWALEWNMNMRIVGLIGDQEASEAIAKKMPELKFYDLPSASGETWRFREESTLTESEDPLFDWEELSQAAQ